MTKIMRGMLLFIWSKGGPIYFGENDRTLTALQRCGFVKYESRLGRRYSKSHWAITDAGRDEAKRISRSKA